MINHMCLNFLCRRLSWSWSGSHASRLSPISSALSSSSVSSGPRARDGFQCNLLKFPVLRAETRTPERIASHDSHQPISVSDRSVVSGFHNGPVLRADLLNRTVQYFVGSLWWLHLHRQIPTTRCRRELDLLPCSRIKTETLSLRPKTTPSTTIRHLGDRHQGSSAVDFSALDGHWLSCSIQGAQDPVSLVIHFLSQPAVLYAHPSRESLWTTRPRAAG